MASSGRLKLLVMIMKMNFFNHDNNSFLIYLDVQ